MLRTLKPEGGAAAADASNSVHHVCSGMVAREGCQGRLPGRVAREVVSFGGSSTRCFEWCKQGGCGKLTLAPCEDSRSIWQL